MQIPLTKAFHQILRKTLLLFITTFSFHIINFAEQLPVKVYSSADGLASSVIHNITRDSKGFLWFCARGGLSRFDGYQFTSYKINDEQASNLIHYFLETRDGTYWISADNGLYRVSPQENTEVQPVANPLHGGVRLLNAQKVADEVFYTLYEDKAGRFWGASGADKGLFLIEDQKAEKVTLREVVFSPTAKKENRIAIRSITQGGDGSLWVMSMAGPMRLLPDNRWVEYPVPRLSDYERPYSIRFDKSGQVWFSHNTGVYFFQPEPVSDFPNNENHFIRSLPVEEQDVGIVGTVKLPSGPGKMYHIRFNEDKESNTAGQTVNPDIEEIYSTADGKMWLPTTKSLYVFDGGNYLRLRDTNSLPGASAQIIEDLQGNLWFGTFGGVVKMARNGLITYNQASGLTEPIIHSIQETPKGELLVSHGRWLVSIVKAEGITTARLNLSENTSYIWTGHPIFQDQRGAIWSLTDRGLFRFSKFGVLSELERQSPKNMLAANPLLDKTFWYRTFSDRQGNIWFASRGNSEKTFFLKFNLQTEEWMDYTHAEGFPTGKPIASLAEDKAGNLWFGFYGQNGIVKYSNGHFTPINPEDGLPKGTALGLIIDKKGRLWIASTESGVSRLDDPTAEKLEFVRFTENEGLANNNVRCLAEDNDGNIYAGTVRGVSQINPETGIIKNITTEDGLASDFVHTAFRDSHGAMWFGTANGLSKFEPKKENPPPAPPIFISDLEIAGITYSISEFGQKDIGGIEVGSSENNLQINFFSIGEKGSLRYQYKLEGTTQADWSVPSEQRSINFGNLSSGTYRFLVRAVNNAGTVSDHPATVSFKINPPFYRAWWFITLAFLMLAGSIFTLDRYRVRKTHQVENALNETKRANALIRESETRFRTLADTASDAILTIDAESNIIFVNQAIEKVFGYSAEELIGQKMVMLMPERMREGHNAGINRYLSTNKKNINWEGVSLPGLHKDGHEIPLEVSFGEFERAGKRFFTGIARDVSERKRAEKALQEAREEKFRELERVRSRIATDLHDDIGSSLTQIAVLSEVARGQAHHLQAENLSTPLERIKGVSRELVSVMSDIVWAINPTKDNLPDLVQRMRRFGSDVLSGRGIRFEFYTPEVEGDLALGANLRREVFAIFKEAVNNAAKYAEATETKVSFQIEDDWISLKIEDNGKGFDTEEILSDEFRPEMGGNGLVNIRRRAKDLGGTCQILSHLDQGTKIQLKIPLHLQDNHLSTNGEIDKKG